MKKKVDVFQYAGDICNAMRKGILLTTKADDVVNTMTIGWGKIGIEWNRPVFIAYVRESRYTREMLERNGEFTVNVALENADGRILAYCGRNSGRDTNKIRDMGLTLIPSDVISVPGFKEFPLTLECHVIYQYKQEITKDDRGILEQFYPEEGEQGTRDFHIAYYGEIVNAYLWEA